MLKLYDISTRYRRRRRQKLFWKIYLGSREASHFTEAIGAKYYVTWVRLIVGDEKASVCKFFQKKLN